MKKNIILIIALTTIIAISAHAWGLAKTVIKQRSDGRVDTVIISKDDETLYKALQIINKSAGDKDVNMKQRYKLSAISTMLQAVMANRGEDNQDVLKVLDAAIEKIIKINSK